MKGELSHLTSPEAVALLDAPYEQRELYILAEKFIAHRATRPTLDHLEYLLTRPPNSRMHGMLMTGPSGLGKTQLLTYFAGLYPPTANHGHPRAYQVVYCEIPSTVDLEELQHALLDAIDAPPIAKGSKIGRNKYIKRLLEDAGVRMIIFDELNNLSVASSLQQQLLYNWFKYLSNNTRIPIILAGTRGCERAVLADPQLRSRFPLRELPAWQLGPDLAAFLLAYERCLPLKKPSYLSSREMMKALLKETTGTTRDIVRCLEYAAIVSIREGQEYISQELLPRWRNPEILRTLPTKE